MVVWGAFRRRSFRQLNRLLIWPFVQERGPQRVAASGRSFRRGKVSPYALSRREGATPASIAMCSEVRGGAMCTSGLTERLGGSSWNQEPTAPTGPWRISTPPFTGCCLHARGFVATAVRALKRVFQSTTRMWRVGIVSGAEERRVWRGGLMLPGGSLSHS